MPRELKARAQAFDLLLPVDPRCSLISVGEALIDAAAEKETGTLIADAFGAVSSWLSNEKQPVVDVEHMTIWDGLRRREGRLIPELADGAEFLEPILLAIYLRAKAALGAASGRQFLGDLENNMRKVGPTLDKMPPGIFGELLVETERRACRDSEFAKALETAAAEIGRQAPYIQTLEQRGRSVLRRRKNGEECSCVVTACRQVGTTRDCRNFCIGSWWICFLIFLAIIVIIVAT